MNESAKARQVNTHLPPEILRGKVSGDYTNGFADWYYSGFKSDIWIEYKKTNNKAKCTPSLTELQKQWLRNQYKRGRQVFVVLFLKKGAIIIKDLDWERQVEFKNYPILKYKDVANFIIDLCGLPNDLDGTSTDEPVQSTRAAA